MIEKNRKKIKIFNLISDMILVVASYVVAMVARYDLFNGSMTVNPFETKFLIAIAVLAFAMSVAYQVFRNSYWNIVIINAIGTLALMAMFFLDKEMHFSRWSLVLFFVLATVLVISKHAIGHKLVSQSAILGNDNRVIALVGNGRTAEQYKKDIARSFPNYKIVPFDYDNSVDEIVIALEPDDIDKVKDVIGFADKEGIYLSLIPFYSEYIPAHPEIESVGKTKLINLRATPLDNFGNATMKRAFDIVGALAMLTLLSPLMLGTALGVVLSSPGPVFFSQPRVGKDKKTFNMLKFRSMRVNNESETAWSTEKDPRRTKFGSFIRKYSIDELPQLINVLKGDMSLVGPRPEIPFYVQQFKESVPLYLTRQQARPGMTGWAQIHGLRGDTSISDRVEYDIWYIENWSAGLDLEILLSTVFKGKFKNDES